MKNLIEEEIQKFNRVFPNSTFRYQERKVVQVYLRQSLTRAILSTAERFEELEWEEGYAIGEFNRGVNFQRKEHNKLSNQIKSELNGEENV